MCEIMAWDCSLSVFAACDTADIGNVLTAGWLSYSYSIGQTFSSGFSYRQAATFLVHSSHPVGLVNIHKVFYSGTTHQCAVDNTQFWLRVSVLRIYTRNVKVNQSRYRPGVAQRVPRS